MDTSFNPKPATQEIFWAAMLELKEKFAETDRVLSEKFAETDRQITRLEKQVGGISNNHGCFVEEYFFNSFGKGQQNFFGEKFDDIKKNLKGIKTDDEFDIVMLNGQSAGIVEVKFKAHINDIPEVLGKADAFRANFPTFTNHKIYIGLASMSFYPELEKECLNYGIAIIKQSGNTIVINDKHLKTF